VHHFLTTTELTEHTERVLGSYTTYPILEQFHIKNDEAMQAQFEKDLSLKELANRSFESLVNISIYTCPIIFGLCK
jgi:hypothetical protein